VMFERDDLVGASAAQQAAAADERRDEPELIRDNRDRRSRLSGNVRRLIYQ
jgi:hypothetical protein